MASLGYLDTLLQTLDPVVRQPIKDAFRYVMRELALGGTAKAENFAWFQVSSTTHATANTEFTIVHGMDHAPSKLIPVLPLDSTTSQLVPLAVTRVSDATRVYLKSTSTSAQFLCYLE